MSRFALALLLLAGCPGSDDSGDDGAASGTSSGGSTGGSVPCDECDGDPSCRSHIGVSGHCVCDAGHEWADLNNADDYTCVPIPPRPDVGNCGPDNHSVLVDGECYCDVGYNWCSDDPADLTCCSDAGQGNSESTG